MEVVIVKMPLEDYEGLTTRVTLNDEPFVVNWLIKEQYFETEEILSKEREAQMSNQHTKDLYKELNLLKHPK